MTEMGNHSPSVRTARLRDKAEHHLFFAADGRAAFADRREVRFRDLQMLRGIRDREVKRLDAVFEQGFSGMAWVVARQ